MLTVSLGILSSLGFSTPAMDEVFSSRSIVDRMLRFEAGLVLALADAGIVSTAEAEIVAEACAASLPDADALLATTWGSGTPVIALIESIGGRLAGPDNRKWLHHGATSQDVIDTTNMLLAKEGSEILEESLVRSAGRLQGLVVEHRNQPQMGRTFLQHAMPTTFGMRLATWLSSFLDRIEEMRDLRAILPVQLGGPVGDLSAYGDKGIEVAASLADRLGLAREAIPWHGDRSIVARVAFAVEDAVATAAKVALDVALLSGSDIGEVTVRAGRSSSMPTKRNPIDAIHGLAAAEVCHGAAAMLRARRPHELDRALGGWHVEWAALPLLFGSAAATLSAVATLVETLEVSIEMMSASAGAGSTHATGSSDPGLIDAVLVRSGEVLRQG